MSQLSDLSPSRRRRLAVMLAVPTATLVMIGVALLVVPGSTAARIGGALVLGIGLLILGIGLGLRRSAAIDEQAVDTARAEAELDAAILAATGGACGDSCDSCGVDDCAVKALPRS